MRPDIYDRLAKRLGVPFLVQHKEGILYLFFGGTSFVLNVGLFALIKRFLPVSSLVNNAVCWTVCVAYQYLTNRSYVFESTAEGTRDVLKEAARFFSGRAFTLVVEELILAVFIELFALPALPVKLAAQAVVIVLNFAISKVFVF